MFAAELREAVEQGGHALPDVVGGKAIVFQIGQQAQHVHGYAFAAAGQGPIDFPLVVLQGLEQIDFGPADQSLAEPSLQRFELPTAAALHLQHAAELGQHEFFVFGQAILQLLGGDNGQASRLALAGLRLIVGGRGVEGDAGSRLQSERAEVPAVLDDAAVALRHFLVVGRLFGVSRCGGRPERPRRFRLGIGAAKHEGHAAKGQVVLGRHAERHHRSRRDKQIRRRLLDGDRGRRIVDGADFPAIVAAAGKALAVGQVEPIGPGLFDREDDRQLLAVAAELSRNPGAAFQA